MARSAPDWSPIGIQAIDMDQPPGIGMAPDIVPALRMVRPQAATVHAPAIDNATRLSELLIFRHR